jgi:hypothetical protein
MHLKYTILNDVLRAHLLKLPSELKDGPTAVWLKKDNTVDSMKRNYANRGARNITDGMRYKVAKESDGKFYVLKKGRNNIFCECVSLTCLSTTTPTTIKKVF